jgi:hypothetical protein
VLNVLLDASFVVCAPADFPFQPSHYATVITDLVARAVHSCYGGHWPSRLGGIAALNTLIARLPSTSLPRLAPVAVKAVFAVLRILPEQSSEERHLSAVLQTVLSRCEVTGTGTFLGKQDYQAPGSKHLPAMPMSPTHNLSQQTQQTDANSEPDSQPMPSLLKQIMEIFVQQLLSSRSSVAVRSVASSGLQVRAPLCTPVCRAVLYQWCVIFCRRLQSHVALQLLNFCGLSFKLLIASLRGACSQYAASPHRFVLCRRRPLPCPTV